MNHPWWKDWNTLLPLAGLVLIAIVGCIRFALYA